MHPGIAPRHGEGFSRDVPRIHPDIRQGKRHTHGNAPAACATVEHPLRTTAAGKRHQQFRFGAGDEHTGVDLKTFSAETGLPRRILQRLPAFEGGNGTLQTDLAIGVKPYAPAHQHIGTRCTEQVVK